MDSCHDLTLLSMGPNRRLTFAMKPNRLQVCGCDDNLQRASIEAEASGHGPVDWCTTWRSLRLGTLKVKWTFSTAERHYALFSVKRSVSTLDATATGAPLLETWLLGTPQKVISLELGVPASSVTARLKRSLAALGVECQPSKVPLVVGLLAAASTGRSPVVDARLAELRFGPERYLVLGVARPEVTLAGQLSPAEYQTMCLLVEGFSYARIAHSRKVAGRTVANQVASMFRRLGISGRSELRGFLLSVSSGDAGTVTWKSRAA